MAVLFLTHCSESEQDSSRNLGLPGMMQPDVLSKLQMRQAINSSNVLLDKLFPSL